MLLKSRDEEGWTDVTKAEYDAFVEEMEADMEDADRVKDAQNAAELATQTAAALTAKAGKADQLNNTAKKTAGRKSNVQKAEEAAAQKLKDETEARVREAEGDKVKYDALTDDEKEMYTSLGLEEITA